MTDLKNILRSENYLMMLKVYKYCLVTRNQNDLVLGEHPINGQQGILTGSHTVRIKNKPI